MTDPNSKKINAACLILAGGQGRRLSPDKPLLEINGKSIIERTANLVTSLFEEVFIVTNTPKKYEMLNLPYVSDERMGCGPLMGIYSGLQKIKHEAAFVCAADMPFLNKEIILSMSLELGKFDIIIPRPGKRPEFLHAFFNKRCLPGMRENLEANLLKVEMLAQRYNTLYLDKDWFIKKGMLKETDTAFININTIEDYQNCLAQSKKMQDPEQNNYFQLKKGEWGQDTLKSIAPDVLHKVRMTLIEQETAYQNNITDEVFSSLWSHGSRVGRIAHYIAKTEGLEVEPALLAGLLHDIGKFAHGSYHENDMPEEENAVQFAAKILSGTIYEKWIPEIREAILSTYLEGEATNDIGRVLYDADRIDKLGNMGVAQFFTKNALRRQFLDEDLLIRTSVELTYAYHAPDTLTTATGRSIARDRSIRTRRFYTELLEEWKMLGLGEFNIIEEDIAGIVCILVVPCKCLCGGSLKPESDIQDALKCRSVVVKYVCAKCGIESEFSFCLPNVKGLPLIT